MKITRKWLKLLDLEEGKHYFNIKSDYLVTSRGHLFKTLSKYAISSVAAILFPVLPLIKKISAKASYINPFGSKWSNIPLYKWAFDKDTSFSGRIARSLIAWPLALVYGVITLGIVIPAIVGAAVLAAVTLPFTLLADGVVALVNKVKELTGKGDSQNPVSYDGDEDALYDTGVPYTFVSPIPAFVPQTGASAYFFSPKQPSSSTQSRTFGFGTGGSY